MVYQSSSRSLLAFGRTIMPRPCRTRTGLQMLPVELICIILENLEMSDLLSCTLVSKMLRRTIKESSRLTYTIELAKNRMISLLPSSSSSPSFASRLNFLRGRENAWKYLNFKRRRLLVLPPTGSVYEFVGGLYGNGREDQTRSISFLELPSLDAALLGDPQHELKVWTHAMEDLITLDFTMDPSQDLFVLVALALRDSKWVYELHLRTIRTNQAHPKAPITVLQCLASPTVQPQPSDIVAAVRVQVFGDLVALLIKDVFENGGAHLEIWNWRSGSSYSSAMFQRTGIDDFTFLTRESFLLVRPGGKFEVYDFADPVENHTVPIHRVSYAFPTLSEDYIYWYISMSNNPTPGYVPHYPTSVNEQDTILSGCRQLYYPHPEDRIHACCLYIINPTGDENTVVHSFVFFVNLRTILNPPADWFTHHQVQRKKKRARMSRRETSILDGEAVHPSTSAQPSSQVPNHQTVVGSASSGSSYPPFPTFDAFPIPPSWTTNGQNNISPTATITAPPTSLVSPSSQTSNPTSNSSQKSEQGVTIPWTVWGPQSTRWFEECLSTDWQHAVYGSRTVESLRSENHPAVLRSSGAGSAAPAQHTHNDHATDSDEDEPDGVRRSSSPQRYLRIRNFNPYAFKDGDLLKLASGSGDEPRVEGAMLCDDDVDEDESRPETIEGNRKDKEPVTRWNRPRLVTEPTTTPVKGVFAHDIVSWLPYTEVISEETYEVSDVMMDDSRLLLLKRGRTGRIKRVEVLMT